MFQVKFISNLLFGLYKILLEKMRQQKLIDYNEYSQRYNSECQNWRSQPVFERKFNNPVCAAIFAVFTLVFFGVGGYYISTKDQYEDLNPNQNDNLVVQRHTAPILTCIFASILISFIYILLIKLMPKVMVMVMIFVSLGLIAVLCIIGIATQNYGLAISMGVTFLVYGIILACFRNKIKMGIVLVKVATNFITQKPIVFITPIIKVFMTVIFAVFWIYSISYMSQKADRQEKQNQSSAVARVFTGVWVLFWLFYTFFFYYLMVFTIAVTCSFWYYGVEGKNPIITAYKWIAKSALGAITFAALLISLVTLARMIIEQKRKTTNNIGIAICLCILSCILRQIEALIKILNHNTVICMAVTGQDFIDSAKTAIGIICSDFPLFSISRLITNLLVFWGVILSVGISCVIAYLWVGLNDSTKDDAGWVILIVAFGSIMISGMIYSILVESVSSVFIFYCFDRRFKELGFQSHNMPQQINQALGNAGYQANQSYEKLDKN